MEKSLLPIILSRIIGKYGKNIGTCMYVNIHTHKLHALIVETPHILFEHIQACT